MQGALEWVIAVAVGLFALVGGIVVRDRQVHRSIAEGDAALHARVTKVQEEYVRRDDLNGHIASIENGLNQMREEQRETNRRIDALLTAMTKQASNRQ